MTWLLIVAVVIVVMVAFAWLVAWLCQRSLGRQDRNTADLIKPPVYKFYGQDDALRVRAEQRRKAAGALRSHAARVESGVRPADVVRFGRRS
jgi:flagellar basal body-associated protein FliL